MLSKLLREHDQRQAAIREGVVDAAAGAGLTAPGDLWSSSPAHPPAEASTQAVRPPTWTTLPALPVPLPLQLPPIAARLGAAPRRAAGQVNGGSAPRLPGRAAEVTQQGGLERVRLPDVAHLSGHLAVLRFAPLPVLSRQPTRLPEKFYQALRHEFFPHLLSFADQVASPEQVAGIIVSAMYHFNEHDSVSIYASLTAMVPFLLEGLLPPGRPDLMAMAARRLERLLQGGGLSQGRPGA